MTPSARSLVQSTSTFLLIGFLALLSIVATNFWLGERAQFYFDDAMAARDARVAAVELRNSMLTAKLSERGFVITGNEIYLAPYQSAKNLAQRQLLALSASKPSQIGPDAMLHRISELLHSKFEELDRTIALKRSQRDEEIQAIFHTNSGKANSDEANLFLSGIIARADDRLTAGVAEQRANNTWLWLVSGIGAVVIVIVIGSAAFGTVRYTNELRTTRDELNSLNDQLEQRVAVRTSDLASARDRAEVLLAEVNHRVANSLALVSSLVTLQAKALIDDAAKSALSETQDRIFAISLVHKRLYSSSNIRSVALDEYLNGLLDHLRTSLRSQAQGINLMYQIEPVELETDTSINLGVVITELVTNAFKYAYPDGVGDVRVRLSKVGDRLELVVEDDGIGRGKGAPPKGTGVGTKIIHAICKSLHAQIDYRDRRPGTAAHLIFPHHLPGTASA